MVAYNFQERFASDVQQGIKTQTIRAPRKNGHAKPCNRLQLYSGMRTPNCRKLVNPDPICVEVSKVEISRNWMKLDGEFVAWFDVDNFAKADGFACYGEMAEWFENTHGLPFTGVLIKWEMFSDSNS